MCRRGFPGLPISLEATVHGRKQAMGRAPHGLRVAVCAVYREP